MSAIPPLPGATLFEADHAQLRVKRHRIAVTASGLDFNGVNYSNTWIDPVTNTLMLRPVPLTDAWYATTSSRLGLDAFDLEDGVDGWAIKRDYAGSRRLYNNLPTRHGGPGSTTTSFGLNRGFYVGFFTFSAGDDPAVFFECGWSNAGNGSSGVSLRFWKGGQVEIYKGGEPVGYGSIGVQSGKAEDNQFVRVLLIPMRRRELLVYSISGGSGFVHVFDDIAEDEPSPVIVPDERFWAIVPVPATCDVEIAPLEFATSGYATTLPVQLGQAPITGAVLEEWSNAAPASAVTNARVLADPSFGGSESVSGIAITALDGSTPFVPNGTNRDCLVKVSLTGDGVSTPFVYGVHLGYQGEIAFTDDSEKWDLAPFIHAATLDVPDGPDGVSLQLEVMKPDEIEAGYAPGFRLAQPRPVRLLWNDVPWFDGILSRAPFTDAVFDDARRVKLEVADLWRALVDYQFRERVPLDGLRLSHSTEDSAIRFVLHQAGFGDDADLEDTDFHLPSVPPARCGDRWNFLIEEGDTAAEVLERLHTDFAASFLMGFGPTKNGYVFRFRDPATLGETPVVTLYRTYEDAYNALIADSWDPADAEEAAYSLVYGEVTENPLPIEANEVRVSGYDIRNRKPIQAFWRDEPSQDPELPPSSRPANWRGAPLVMGVIEPRCTSIEACRRVVEYIAPLVSKVRRVGGWDSGLLWKQDDDVVVPVWRGDVIELDGLGKYRIASFSAEHRLECPEVPGDPDAVPPIEDVRAEIVRRATYAAIKVGAGQPYQQGGLLASGMARTAEQAARNKVLRWTGYELISQSFQTTTTEVVLP